MLAEQAHRGPDGFNSCTVGLITVGARRLAIVDVDARETAPIHNDKWTLTFNGEIYNAHELRQELQKYGYTFRTNTDTEVVLLAWDKWGSASMDKMNGMFAFAVTDGTTLYLVRDRAGEKPLSYYAQGKQVLFASEAKAIWNIVQTEERFDSFFSIYEYCLEETLWCGIKNVLPGYIVKIDLRKAQVSEVKKWWVPRLVHVDHKHPDEQLEDLIESAVKMRVPDEVKSVLYYSGGVDSELIRSFLPSDYPVLTFDENDIVHEANFLSTAPQIVRHLDFPVGSFSSYGLWTLGERAKRSGAKVALSGEGADELFAGYARTVAYANIRAVMHGMSDYQPMFERIFGHPEQLYALFTNRNRSDSQTIASLISSCHVPESDLLTVCAFEFTYLLPMLLQMGDRMAMAHGVENRCPFLDPRIIDFAFSLRDDSWRVDGLDGKAILRTILRRRVPKAAALTAPKKGLYVPVNRYIGARNKYDRDEWIDYQMAIWRSTFPSR